MIENGILLSNDRVEEAIVPPLSRGTDGGRLYVLVLADSQEHFTDALILRIGVFLRDTTVVDNIVHDLLKGSEIET